MKRLILFETSFISIYLCKKSHSNLVFLLMKISEVNDTINAIVASRYNIFSLNSVDVRTNVIDDHSNRKKCLNWNVLKLTLVNDF